jgi:hypothetical protein
MEQKEKSLRMEQIVLGMDRKNAKRLLNIFMKLLSKDKKSAGMRLTYSYRAFRKRAEYTIEGHPKTVSKCLGAYEKFILKQEKAAARAEEKRCKAKPIKTGKYYKMKPAKERKHDV